MASPPPPDRPVDDSTPVSSDDAELAIDGNVAARAPAKKPAAWSKPSSSSSPVDVGPVMGGAASWPPLPESARASPRPSVPDPPQDLSPPPVISSPTKKSNSSNQNPNPNSPRNQPGLARHKSMKRGGGGGGGGGGSGGGGGGGGGGDGASSSTSVPVNGGELPPAESPAVEPVNRGNHNGDHGFRGSGPDHQRSSYGGGRRGTNGGNAPHHSNFGHRRDHDWGHRSFNGRDSHMQPVQNPRGGGPRPYIRPTSPAAAAVAPPFIGPPPLQSQPFGPPPIGFPDMNSALYPMAPPPPLEPFGGVPFITAVPQALYVPAMDSSHRAALLKQIDYYFSTENLCKDTYLRQKMDEQGWVPVSLIAGFNKVQQLTNNIHYILDTVQYSTVVEVQGDRIRRRNDWMNWMLPQPNYDTLSVHMEGIGLDDGVTNSSRRASSHTGLALSRSSSGNLNEQSQVGRDPFVDGNGQIAEYTDRRLRSARSLSRSDTL